MAVDKLSISRLKKLGDGKHSDGGGLYFFVRGSSQIWTFRYVDPVTKKRRERSLGTYPATTLADARRARDAARGGSVVEGDRSVTKWVARAFDAKRGKLKGDTNWMGPLNVHVLPVLGAYDITRLTAQQIEDVIRPIWHSAPIAALKALTRLGYAMTYAAAHMPYMDATVVSRARTLLGDQGHTVTHYSAMPWRELPAFYASLGSTPTELAMRLLILTASRTGPIRLARTEQFEGNVWSVPAENMKNGKPFRVPLSDEAMRLVDLARPLARDGFLFCAYQGKPISYSAMTKYLNRRHLTYRAHGFRASFKTWAEDNDMPWKPTEMSLAHTVGSEVEQSYARSDLLERRRPLMQQWSDYVTGPRA